MQRRAVLAVCGAGFAWLAGCSGGGNGAGEPTDSPGSTTSTGSVTPTGTTTGTSTTVSDAEQPFRAAVDSVTDGQIHFSSSRGTWTLEYPVEVTSGDRFDAQQAEIAEAFVSARPDNTTLVATATHECQTVAWAVPADLAREHDRGQIGTDELVSRVQNDTTRESHC